LGIVHEEGVKLIKTKKRASSGRTLLQFSMLSHALKRSMPEEHDFVLHY
jgi:hypothetical protein